MPHWTLAAVALGTQQLMSHRTLCLDERQFADLRAAVERDPAIKKWEELLAAHARSRGGETLAVLRALQGPIFGDRTLRSTHAVAAELGIPVSRVGEIYSDAVNAITPAWKSSPQYKAHRPARRS